MAREATETPRKGKRSAPNRTTFTDIGVRRLKPPKEGQVLYWDVAQKGLSLLVSSGGTKSFRSQYQYQGQWVTRKLGRFGEMKPDDGTENFNVATAREMVRNDRALAKQGIDPRDKDRQAQKVASTLFGDVVDQFIELYAKPRQRTWEQTQRVLKGSCAPWLRKPIGNITKRMAYDLLDGFVAAGHGHKARITLAWLKTLWRWAYKRDLVTAPVMDQVEIAFEKKERNPFHGMDKQQRAERIETDVKAIWKAADLLSQSKNRHDKVEGAYVKLLLLLAPRKSELAGMRRSELNDHDKPTLWTTPHERTKSKKTAKAREYLTPLPPLAQRILKSLPKGDDDLVFPGAHKGLPIWPGSPLKKKLVGRGVPKDFAYHSIRHYVATWLQDAGHSEFEVGLVLNHAGGGNVTAGYSHGYPIELKRELLIEWADHVAGLVTPKGAALHH